MTRSRWWMPAVSLAMGAAILVAFVIGGNAVDGVRAFAVLAALALVLAVGSTRSETLGGLGGPARDERWQMIDLRASWFAGLVVILALIGAWLYELADGRDGSPYGQLMAVGGVAYIAAIAYLHFRA